ncbi:MAG TPA: zinc ribbon domain-containing protein [Anaerolineae bacterium]|nr:zinc ribbon domain-containing protein [Anaerolineae bacterium]
MDILALLIGLALVIGLIFFIGQPLRQARRATPAAESQLDTLFAQREALYTQIRELDFDHATGKIIAADHDSLRARLVAQAADVLRQIDALAGPAPAAAEDALEAAIAARRKRKPATADAELEAAIAERRKRKPAEGISAAPHQALACPNCGKPSQAGDAFCSKCGAPLGTQVAR